MQVNINAKGTISILLTAVTIGVGWWMTTVWNKIDNIDANVVELEKRDVTIVLHSKALDDALETIGDLNDEINDLYRIIYALEAKVGRVDTSVGPAIAPPPPLPIPEAMGPETRNTRISRSVTKRGLEDYNVEKDDLAEFQAEQKALPPIERPEE